MPRLDNDQLKKIRQNVADIAARDTSGRWQAEQGGLLGTSMRYMDRVGRLAGLGAGAVVGTGLEALLDPMGAMDKEKASAIGRWLPDIKALPSAMRQFWDISREGDWDAAIAAAQDEMDAGKYFWGAAEAAGSFIPTGGPALAGSKLISMAPKTGKILGPAMRGAGWVAQRPWELEEWVGRKALSGIAGAARMPGRIVQGMRGAPVEDIPITPKTIDEMEVDAILAGQQGEALEAPAGPLWQPELLNEEQAMLEAGLAGQPWMPPMQRMRDEPDPWTPAMEEDFFGPQRRQEIDVDPELGLDIAFRTKRDELERSIRELGEDLQIVTDELNSWGGSGVGVHDIFMPPAPTRASRKSGAGGQWTYSSTKLAGDPTAPTVMHQGPLFRIVFPGRQKRDSRGIPTMKFTQSQTINLNLGKWGPDELKEIAERSGIGVTETTVGPYKPSRLDNGWWNSIDPQELIDMVVMIDRATGRASVERVLNTRVIKSDLPGMKREQKELQGQIAGLQKELDALVPARRPSIHDPFDLPDPDADPLRYDQDAIDAMTGRFDEDELRIYDEVVSPTLVDESYVADQFDVVPQVTGAGRVAGTEAIAAAQTGRMFSGTFFRGSGRDIAESVYNPDNYLQEALLGKATYATPDPEVAKFFGPDVAEVEITLNNPLVISNDSEWLTLTNDAGLFSHTPTSSDQVVQLRNHIEGLGHDGVVIRVPPTEETGKRLMSLFDSDQVISFAEPRMPLPAPSIPIPGGMAEDVADVLFRADSEQYLPDMPDEIDDILGPPQTTLSPMEALEEEFTWGLRPTYLDVSSGPPQRPITTGRSTATGQGMMDLFDEPMPSMDEGFEEALGFGAGDIPPQQPPVGSSMPDLAGTPGGPGLMVDLQDIKEAINIATIKDLGRKIASLPGFRNIIGPLNRAAVANTPVLKGIMGRHILRSEGEQHSQQVMASVTRLGTFSDVFGRTDARGIIREGPLTNVEPNDLRTRPQDYADRLTEPQKRWLDAAHDIEVEKLAFLERNGIDINKMTFENGGVYAGRHIFARYVKDEIVEVGSAGPRIGPKREKAGFEMGRQFETAADAIEEGFVYMSPDEALMLNVRGAYNRVADKKFTDWMLENVQTVKAGEVVGPSGVAFRRAGPKAARREGEVSLWDVSPAFRGKVFTGPKAMEAKQALMTSMNPQFNAALHSINKVNAIGRFFTLAGDASPFLIQMMFMIGSDPKAFGQAMKGFVRGFVDSRYHSTLLDQNREVLQRHRGLLTTLQGNEMTEAMEKGGLLRAKVVRPYAAVLTPFQRAFNSALDTAGIEMAKGLDHLAKGDAARMADIDAFINEIRGLASSSRIGVSSNMRLFETAFLLAPRYNRAVAAFLWDAAQGAVTTGREGSLRTKLARNALLATTTGIIAAGSAITLGLYNARTPEKDQNWEDAQKDLLDHINPASGRFLTWDVFGRNIGPGTKVRSIIKLLAQSAADPTSLANLDLIANENPALRFIRGSMAPVPSDAWDIFSGYSYVGEPTRGEIGDLSSWKKAIPTVLLPDLIPIWTQAVLMEGGTPGEKAVGATVEFFGGRAYPQTIKQRAQELHRQDPEASSIPWDRLDLTRKDQYTDQASEERGEEGYTGPRGIHFERRDEINEEHLDTVLREVAGRLESRPFSPGHQPRTARNKLSEAKLIRRQKLFGNWDSTTQSYDGTGVYDDMYPEHEEEEPDPVKEPLQHVLWRYYRMYEHATDPTTGKLDFDILEELEGQLWASLSPDESRWLLDSIRRIENDYPEEAQRLAAVSRYVGSVKVNLDGETLGYWDLVNHARVKEDMLRRLPGVEQRELEEYLDADYDLRQDLKAGDDIYEKIEDVLYEVRDTGGSLNMLKRAFIKNAPAEWYETMIVYGYQPYGHERAREYMKTQTGLGAKLTDVPYEEEYEETLLPRQ